MILIPPSHLSHPFFESFTSLPLSLFVRTPPLHNDERQDDPCAVLARHLPKQAHAMIFGGESATPSKKNASDVSSKRRIAAMSVYIVSTNKEHESGLSFLFQDIKLRIFKLQATDFFSKEDGAYEGIGVDRVAALLAATTLNQERPVMVFDAGTAWTYTILDRQRKIMGGGISLGVQARFRAMADYCGELPIIEYAEYQEAVTKTLESKKPFPTFAKDTKGAMMTTVFSEIANQCRSLVKQFLEVVKEEKVVDNDGENKENTGEPVPPVKKPTIVVTGGDSLFLKTLFENDQHNLVAGEPGTSLPVEEFELSNMKHLVHHGIAQLLSQKVDITPSENEEDKLREFMLGHRVAQNFEVADDDGEFVYRGSVMSIKKDEKDFEEDLFVIKYDDGDAEQMDFKQVHGTSLSPYLFLFAQNRIQKAHPAMYNR
jgi:pantothenate kinase type III